MIPFSLFALLVLVSPGHVLAHEGVQGSALGGDDFLGRGGRALESSPVEDLMVRLGQSGLRKTDGQPLSLYLPVFAEPNSTCRVALDKMASSLEGDVSIPVLKMVDSWGKFRDGYFFSYFSTVSLGEYSECVHAEDSALGLKGRFCSVFLADNMSAYEAEPRMPQASANTLTGIAMMYTTCIPDACSEEELQKSVNEALGLEKFAAVFCQSPDDPPQFEAGDIAMITFLSVMLALLVAGTLVDVVHQRLLRSKPVSGLRFLIPFSVYTNLDKIFQISTEARPGVITCLHGMRVLSMMWVIYGHQNIFDLSLTANFFDVVKWTKTFLFQAISNATVSTDSFFFLSGLLVSYGVLKEIKKTGKLNIIMYYVHRFIRLTPPIALVSLFMATLFRFFTTGPLAMYAESTKDMCVDTWWMDTFYVNNFLGYDKETNQLKDCLGQCWYTAVDTQLYLVAPIVLLPLAFHPKIGEIFLFLVTLASVIIPAAVVYVNNFPPGSIFDLTPEFDQTAFQRLMYFAPWCRMSAYIVGIWTGYFLFKQGSKKLAMNPLQVMTGWTVAAFSAVAVLFGMFSYNQLTYDVYPYDPVTQVLYGGLHRAVWCASLAWVVVACHFGYGGVVNDFLSHPTWQPLSRLTYTMYLVAIPVQLFEVYQRKSLPYFSYISRIFDTCGTTFISIIAALLVSLTVEAPVLGLEKLLLRRPGHGEENLPVPPTEEKKGQENLGFEEEEVKVDLQEEEPKENGEIEMKETDVETPSLSKQTAITAF